MPFVFFMWISLNEQVIKWQQQSEMPKHLDVLIYGEKHDGLWARFPKR